VPTLVVHRKDEAIPIEYAREVAAGIPSARIVELEGVDHWPTVGDIKSITGEIEEFLTGQRQAHLPDRVLATVLFTDIVDSTRHAARLGDRSWRELLTRHNEVTHTEISRRRLSRDIRRPDARPSVCDHDRGADAGIGYRCAMWSAHRRV